MDLRALHDLSVSAAREAGAAIRSLYQDAVILRDKGDDNPLTEADLAADAILEGRLRHVIPDAGWLSEETGDDLSRLGKPACWIIDPLDGTKEFTKGIPEFVVSIALVVGAEAAVGVLYNPITDELFSGIVGVGAWLNGQPISCTRHGELQGARVVCSRTEASKGWFDPWKDQLNLIPTGSVAFKFGLVAAGRAEATFTNQPRNAWDIAGGVAIVNAAGGRCTNRHGQPYRFNQPDPLQDGVCCTNGALHDKILDVMKQHKG